MEPNDDDRKLVKALIKTTGLCMHRVECSDGKGNTYIESQFEYDMAEELYGIDIASHRKQQQSQMKEQLREMEDCVVENNKYHRATGALRVYGEQIQKARAAAEEHEKGQKNGE